MWSIPAALSIPTGQCDDFVNMCHCVGVVCQV